MGLWNVQQMDDDTLERLINSLREEVEEWRDSDSFHSGDRGFQDLLEDLNDLEEEAVGRELDV